MRSLLVIVALVSGALAAPADGPQLILTNGDDQDVTLGRTVSFTDFDGFTQDHGVIETNETIYTYLSQETRYTKLVKLIDFDEEYVTILNATTDRITFFAPDNKALTPHKKGEHHGTTLSLSTIYDEYERLQTNARDDDDDEEKKKRFKKILRALLKYHTLPAALDKSALYANTTFETAWKAKDGSYDRQYRRISVGNSLFGKLTINFHVGVEWQSVAAENGFIYGIEHPIIPPPSILDELFLLSDFSFLTSALQKVGLDDALQWRFKKSSKIEGDGPVVSLFAPSDFAFKRLPPGLRFYLFSPAGEKALKKILQYHIVPDFILHSDWVHDATSDDDLVRSRVKLVEECEGDDWYADNKVSPFSGISRDAEKMMRKLRKKVTSDINLRKDGVVAEVTGEEPPKRCLGNRRASMTVTITNWPHRGHQYPNITVNITIPTLLDDHSLRFVVGRPKKTSTLVEPEVEAKPRVSAWPLLIRGHVFVNGQGTGPEAVARNGAVYALHRLLHPYKPSHDLEGDHKEQDNRWDDWEEWLPAWGEQ